MKKTLLNNLKLIAFGMVFAISLSYVHATYWAGNGNAYSDPTTPASGCTSTTGTATPPQCNTPALPLNVSTLDQIKPKGGCAVSNCGGLSLLKTFVVELNAEFDGTVFLNGIVGAGTGSMATNSTVRFGGIDPTGNPQPVSIAMSGGLSANTLLQSGVLANSGGNLPICSDQNGYVTLCDITYVCSNLSGGPYTTVPPNYTQNPDGTCTQNPKEFLAEIPYQKFDSYPLLYGNVSGGNIQDHVATPPGNTYLPLVDSIGFYNGCGPTIGCTEWLHNEIPGVIPTSFSDSGAQLINGAQAGTYSFSIKSTGNIGIKGKYYPATNNIGADFYLRICHSDCSNSNFPNSDWPGQWIEMDNNSSILMHEEYPVAGDTTVNDGNRFNTNGSSYDYVPYTLNFQKTISLLTGDHVYVYALIYGSSERGPVDFTNFYYSIDAGSTEFKIIETNY